MLHSTHTLYIYIYICMHTCIGSEKFCSVINFKIETFLLKINEI